MTAEMKLQACFRLAEYGEPALVVHNRRPCRNSRPDVVQRFLEAVPVVDVLGADRLQDVPRRVDDEAALRFGFGSRSRRHWCGQVRSRLDDTLELVLRQPVPLLAEVLVAPAAVLVEPPDIRGE